MRQIVLIVLIIFSFPAAAAADRLYTRNLACGNQSSERSVQICTALQAALAWGWTGHAIISPGFRLKTERMRDLFCSLPITEADTSNLINMALESANLSGMLHAQINNGALTLLSMLGHAALNQFPIPDEIADKGRRDQTQYLKEHITIAIEESSPSIFNPSHPGYILRNGCP